MSEFIINSLREEEAKLKEKLSEVQSLIKSFTATTADGYQIVPGVIYFYENGFGKRNPIVFDDKAKFWQDVIWVQVNERESCGYYYTNLYRFKDGVSQNKDS